MHPEDIKASLRKASSSCAAIARELQVSKTTVFLVIHGRTTSARIARLICERAKLDPEKAWPGRYPDLQISRPNASSTAHLKSDRNLKRLSNTSTSTHLKGHVAHAAEAV